MLAVIAAIGWLLALAALFLAGWWFRMARTWRQLGETLMATHRPGDFAAYTAKLSQRGQKPLVTSDTKET